MKTYLFHKQETLRGEVIQTIRASVATSEEFARLRAGCSSYDWSLVDYDLVFAEYKLREVKA